MTTGLAPTPTLEQAPPRKGRLRVTGPIIPSASFSPIEQGYPTRREYNEASRPAAERQQTISGVGELLPTVYGTDRVGARVTAVVTDSFGYLLLRCEWCKGPIDSVNAILIDDAAMPSGVTATHYDGTQVTADATLVGAYAAQGKSYTDTLTGIAYSVVRAAPGSTQGFPRVVGEIKGLEVKTTFAGTPAYNDNPVWMIAWLITERLGQAINWTSFATAAADACDVLVGGEKKRTIGITLETEQGVNHWIDLLLGYAGCFLWFDDGEYGLTADTATTHTSMAITESLMKDGLIELQSRNTKNAPTVVRVWYTNTSQTPWRDEYAEAVDPDVGTTKPYRLSEIRMPGIQRHSQANREAIERLNDYVLNDISGSFVTRDQGLKLLNGDIIEITHSVGLTAKKFRLTATPSPVDRGRWSVAFREFDPAKYSSVVASGPTFTDTDLPDPNEPPTVGAVTLTEEIVTVPTGALPLSRIRGAWTALSTYPFLAGYRVIVTDYEETTIIDTQDVSSNAYLSPPLNALATYVVKVYARSSVAVGSTASAATITLTANGVGALAAVYSQAVTGPSGWTLTHVETFKLWAGDPYFRLRTASSAEPVETAVYTGSNQSTPGKNTQLLDSKSGLFSPPIIPTAESPIYDIGTSRTAVFAMLNIARWVELYQGAGSEADTGAPEETETALVIACEVSDSPAMTGAAVVLSQSALGTGRYCRFNFLSSARAFPTGFVDARLWQVEFDQASIAALMPTVTDTVSATSSASGGVTVSLPRKYITVTGVQITSQSTTQANTSYSNLTLSETVLADNTLQLHCYDASNARIAVPCSIQITGVEAL